LYDNRRQYQRLELDHPANLFVGGQPVARCRIKNYSEGGLYLQLDAETLVQLKVREQSLEGKAIHAVVRLLHPSSDMELPFEVPVRIAFAGKQGFGTAFMEPSEDVLNYLQQRHQSYEPSTEAEATTPISENSMQLLSQVKALLVEYIEHHFPLFVDGATDLLLDKSEHVSLQDQPNFSFASTAIQSSRESFQKNFVSHVLVGWEQLFLGDSSDGQVADAGGELELVDQTEFDEWASVTAVARQSESNISHTLYTISQCFASVLRMPVSSDRNPLSPYALLWALKKAQTSLGLHSDARDLVYSVFGQLVLKDMPPLYARIYALFEAAGVAAKVAENAQQVRDSQSNRQAQRVDGKQSSDRRRPRNLISTLSSLFAGKPGGKKSNAPPPSDQAIFDALDTMSVTDSRNLVDQLEHELAKQAGGGEPIQLQGDARQAVAATGQVIGSTENDPRYEGVMRDLLKHVQLPLAKSAITDSSALNDKDGVSRKLLNDIDQLALLVPSSATSTKVQKANAGLQELVTSLESAGGQADLDLVSQRVAELLEQRKSEFSSNLEQIQQGCSVELSTAEQVGEIREFFQKELKGTVAGLIDQLLHLGWAGLLVQTATEGEASAQALKTYKSVLVLLTRAFDSKNKSVTLSEEKLSRLGKVLRAGFKAYPLQQPESESLIKQIEDSIRGDTTLFRQHNQDRVEITEAYLDELLPGSIAVSETKKTEGIDKKWLDALRKIQQGDWITHQWKPGQVRLLNLVWIDPNRMRYVFADGVGVKTLDCNENELAEGLESGIYSLIEDGGLPMVERAVNRVLQQTFERLREDSDVDSLTGLQNRRAYERALINLLEISKREKSTHVIACIDIDNFSLVNDLCGNEGGDSLLSTVANVCTSFLPKKGMLARTGDNEFSILVEDCTVDEGYRIVESLRKAIENLWFEWGTRGTSVTASIGFTEITAEGGEPDSFTQAAALACQQAKKEGRNCCRRYQSDGEVFAKRRRLVQSVPMIEKVLEYDQLDLHAQLITPIFMGDGHSDHHEILLRRLDEEGKPGSPFEIIEAAEQYDRMRAVDRWVVTRFFKWAESASKGSDPSSLGGFSVNLSGQSMTNDAFHEFLIRQVNLSALPLNQISFEITETAMVNQIEKAKKLILELQALGCTFFLDDFGSGYANYSYLKDFPVDVVKVDGIFVKSIHEDETSYAMVKSITEVAHHLNKLVVAEYVESEPILNALRELEVDFAQGYCIGRPAPLSDIGVERGYAG